jgi:NitT/TauT family transport system substrate-binding protein
METNKRLILLILAVVIVLLGAAYVSWLRAPEEYSGPMASIIVAHAPYETEVLFYVAQNQHFFGRNGLTITVRKCEFPAASLDAVLNGEADIAVGAAEYALVLKAIQKKRASIIGTICKGEFIYLIGRKDRGITKPSDLKGKKVGTTFGTITDFYLGRLLQLNGLSMNDITRIDLKTTDQRKNALADGSIDAQVAAQPTAASLRDRLGNNATFLSAQSGQNTCALAIATDEWITKHPELVNRFLKSLAQAEEHVIRHPAEAREIVVKAINVDAVHIEEIWSQAQFSLSLDQSLIAAMEDEARWVIKNKLTKEKIVPNFLDYIYEDGLKAVKPEVVNIIR